MSIMASFNRVILMGNLTRDPELRVTPQGTSVCKINVAVNKQIRMSDGGVKDETSFIDVDAFGRQADVIAKYFIKGRPILVEGRLKLDRWETQAGEKRSKLGVILESFQFIGQRNEDDYSLLVFRIRGRRLLVSLSKICQLRDLVVAGVLILMCQWMMRISHFSLGFIYGSYRGFVIKVH